MKKYLLFLIFIAAFAGCKKSDSGKIKMEVAFWGTKEEIPIIDKAVAKWRTEHPEVELVLTHTPNLQYLDRLLTRIAGNSTPDIVFIDIKHIGAFYEKGVLMDLTPFIRKDKTLKLSKFFPTSIDRFSVDGKIYGIPRDIAPFACVYYNKKLFDEAGVPYPKNEWNWNDMLEKTKKLTKKDKNGITVQFGFYTWAWQNFVYSAGGAFVDDVKHPKKCLLGTQESVEGIKFCRDLMHKYGVMPTVVQITQGMFQTGKLAMYGSGIWETPAFRKIKGFEWDFVMFPKGPSGKRAFEIGGSGYGISNTTKYPELAWELLKALSGDEGQIHLADTGLTQPANMEIAKGPHFAGDKRPPHNKAILNEAVKYGVYPPLPFKWNQIEKSIILPNIEKIFINEKDVDSVIKEIVPKINKALNEK